MRYFSIVSVAIVWVLTTPAFADTKTHLTTDDFDLILRAAGFTPDLIIDEDTSEPFASMDHGGYKFSARGKECTAQGCTQILFFANFDMDRDITLSDYRALNSYNDNNVLGRAYAVEKEQRIGIDFVVDLAGGVSTDHIRLGAQAFPELIVEFVEAYRNFGSD